MHIIGTAKFKIPFIHSQ